MNLRSRRELLLCGSVSLKSQLSVPVLCDYASYGSVNVRYFPGLFQDAVASGRSVRYWSNRHLARLRSSRLWKIVRKLPRNGLAFLTTIPDYIKVRRRKDSDSARWEWRWPDGNKVRLLRIDLYASGVTPWRCYISHRPVHVLTLPDSSRPDCKWRGGIVRGVSRSDTVVPYWRCPSVPELLWPDRG